MATGTINKRATGANAIVFALTVVVAIAFANVVFTRAFKRIDFTADKVYTLSPASKELVKKLPDRLTVKAYISKDLQPPFSQVGQFTRDLLEEYAAASNGKFVWEAIDPSGDTKAEEEATKNKVPKMRRGKVSQDKVEIGSNYLGVAFQYQGNIESIPEIRGQEGLEFQMTSIIKMLTVKKKKVAFANSEGELQTAGGDQQRPAGLQFMKQYMNDYDVVPVNLGGAGKTLADDVDALVIAGPKTKMSDRAKYTIDQFLMRGKSVAVFLDGMVVEQAPGGMQGMPAGQEQPRIGRKNEVGMDDLLEHYGLKVRDDLVMEPRQNVPGPIQMAGQMFLANYYTFVASTKLADKHAATLGLKALVLPFPSSIELVKDRQGEVTYTPLVTSTPEAWRQTGFFLFDPQNPKVKPGEDKGPFEFAYAAEGKFKSFFAGKPVPQADGTQADPSQSPASGDEPTVTETKAPARLILVGDSEFAADDYVRFAQQIQIYQSNLLFFMSLMDYLAQDDTLAALRAKTVTSRPITLGSESTAAIIKYGNILGVPLAFIAYGIARWRMRAQRRKNAKVE